MRKRRPGKVKRVTLQAAAKPKIVLRGTARAATLRVMAMECWMLESVKVWRKTPIPLEKASANTATKGSTKIKPTAAKARTVRV